MNIYPNRVLRSLTKLIALAACATSIWTAGAQSEKTPQTISFEDIGTKAFGDAPFSVTATASSTLPVTVSLISGPVSFDGSTVTINGAGEVTLEGVQEGNEFFEATTNRLQFTIAQAATTVTWQNPAPIVYGTALSATQLNATNSQAGTFSYTPGPGAVLHGGVDQVLSVTFTPSSTNYATVTTNVTITVTKKPLLIRANDQWRIAGAVNPSFSSSFASFLTGESEVNFQTPISYSTVADEFSLPGVYAIVPSGVTSSDYDISYANGRLTVLGSAPILSTTVGGDWNSPTTWVGGIVPSASDAAFIVPGAAVTVNGSAACALLQVQNSPLLRSTLSISVGGSLIVGGGDGGVYVGNNIVSASQEHETSITVSGTLRCGQIYMIARRFQGRNVDAFVYINHITAQVQVNGDIVQDRNVPQGTLRNQVRFNAQAILRLTGTFLALNDGGVPAINGPGTVEYNNDGPQVVAGFAYTHLTLTGSGEKTAKGQVAVSAQLTLSGTATYAGTTPNYGANAGLRYFGSVAQQSGSELPAAPTGTWSLVVSNQNGVTLNSSVAVPGTINLIEGTVATGENVLTMAGSLTRSNGWVVGNLQKTIASGSNVSRVYEVGSALAYGPVSLVFADVLTSGKLTVGSVPGDHPLIGSTTLSANESVNVHWNFTAAPELTFSTYNAVFNFASADLDPGTSPELLIAGHLSLDWSYPDVAARTSTSLSLDNLSSFSSFQLAMYGNRMPPAVNWASPTSIVYGTALGASELNASVSETTGTLSYSPALGTILDAGDHTLSVVFTPDDPVHYLPITNLVSLTVSKAPLTIVSYGATRNVGEANPTFTGNIIGLVNNDNISYSLSCAADESSPAGIYVIEVTVIDPDGRLGNYDVTGLAGLLQVKSGLVTVTIAKLPNGNVSLGVVGDFLVDYMIQSANDLSGDWSDVGITQTGSEGLEQPGSETARFYRAVVP